MHLSGMTGYLVNDGKLPVIIIKTNVDTVEKPWRDSL